MRVFLWLALALAACGGDGVHFEVVVPHGMDVEFVDLFVAKGAPCVLDDQGTLCDKIAPPRFDPQIRRELIDGFVFEEDAATVPLHATVEDGSAWFFLAPTPAKVKLMIAIARDHQHAQVGAAVVFREIVLDDGDQYLATELHPTTARLGEGTPAAEEWFPNADGTPYGCVGAQLDSQMPLFIVPESDPDCDGIPADRECAATTFRAQEGVSNELADLTCATQLAACVLGDRACDEVSPLASDNRCIPPTEVRYCVPDLACGCDELDGACAQTFLDGLTNMDPTAPSHIECRFATEDLGGGEIGVCNVNGVTGAKLSLANRTCGSTAEIADFDLSFGQLQGSFALTDGVSTVTIQPELANNPDCEFSLQIPSEKFATGLLGQHVMVVELETIPADGGSPATFTILPLTVELGVPGNCMLESSICTLKLGAGDKVATCLP